MKEYFEILSKCPLFNGIEQFDINSMIECLNGRTINVLKGKPVFLEGDSVQFVGVVLLGAVQVIREDYYGNRSVMAILQPGELFAEVFSCAGLETMPVSVIALTDSKVLLLDCRRVFTSCSNLCHIDKEFTTRNGTEEFGSYSKNPIYVTKNNKRKIDGLSFGSGKTTEKYRICDSSRQTITGRLFRCRAQCYVSRN